MNQAHALYPRPGTRPAPPRETALSSIGRLARSYSLELCVLAAMALRFVPEPFNLTSFLLLAIIAFVGRTGTVFALAAVWFAFSVNPGLAEETPAGSGARYIVIGAAVLAGAFRAARHKVGDRISAATATTAAVATALIIHSTLFSLYPTLSVFKAVLWGSTALTVAASIQGMDADERHRVHRFLLLFFGVILVLSLAVMPLPEARLRNNVGLQGLLNHPQMFGVFCALAGAYYFGTAIAAPKPSWLPIGMVVLALQGIVESAARTGGFALVLACAGLIGLALLRSAFEFRRILPGLFSGRFAVLALIAVLGTILNSDIVRQTTEQFVRKNSRTEQATAAYDASRGFLIQEMRENIERRPAQGIGLGIQSATHLMDIQSEQATGLPLSAPVEKGVMWIAIIEELGLLLGAVVFGWVLWAVGRSLQAGAAAAAASIGYFFTNFAEATFFSPGGIGVLGLILFYLGFARVAGQSAALAAPDPMARRIEPR